MTYLDIGQVLSMSSGDAYKYRDTNERREGKYVSYQKVKNLNVCDKNSSIEEKISRLKEYLYAPVELLNDQDQLKNLKINSKKTDYLVLYSPDPEYLNSKKYEFQINYVEEKFLNIEKIDIKNRIPDIQILFTSNPELIKQNVSANFQKKIFIYNFSSVTIQTSNKTVRISILPT